MKKFLFMFVFFLLSCSILTPSMFAAEAPCKALLVLPYALFDAEGNYGGADHDRYIADFKLMIDHLSVPVGVESGPDQRKINTIMFEVARKGYKYDGIGSNKLAVIAALDYENDHMGFDRAECNEMAQYVRDKGMKIAVCINILSHMDNDAFGMAYPGYLVDEGEAPDQLRDPWNADGEDVMFAMIDEVIDVFTTLDGAQNEVKPEAVNIASDECKTWETMDLSTVNGIIDDPYHADYAFIKGFDYNDDDDIDYAESYAMAINRAYDHIKSVDSGIEVMMWGDMLDCYGNGGEYQTSDALDYIKDESPDMIIIPWHYYIANVNSIGFDFKAGRYLSVERFVDKGFRVIPASWYKMEATNALIWSGNVVEEATPGSVLGHLYTNWTGRFIPYITEALAGNPRPGIKESVLGLAAAINATHGRIGKTTLESYDGSWGGTYPDFTNANDLDGLYDFEEYRDYSYDTDTTYTYSVVDLPLDPVSYWDFEGDADDRAGSNDGTFFNDAAVVVDSERGQVLSVDGLYDGVIVPDDDSLDMTDAVTLSCWFKLNTVPVNDDKITLLGKHFTEYELELREHGEFDSFHYDDDDPLGYIVGLTTSNKERTWEAGRWYHIAWTLDIEYVAEDEYVYKEYGYVDGELVGINTFTKSYNLNSGTNEFRIGGRSGGSRYVDGYIDDAMVFDRALSPAEVKYLYTTQNVLPTPISHWDFEGDADDRVGSNDGTFYDDAEVVVDSARGQVLSVDGLSDGVIVPDDNSLDMTDAVTLSCWFKLNTVPVNDDKITLLGKHFTEYELELRELGKLDSFHYDDNPLGYVVGITATNKENSWVAGRWYHIAWTLDIEYVAEDDEYVYKEYAYVDGELVGTNTFTKSYNLTSGTNTFRIGGRSGGSRYVDGYIDDAMVFDRALSSNQIANQYRVNKQLAYIDHLELKQSIILDVALDEGTGTIVGDDSPNGIDGGIIGSNYSWVSGISGYAVELDGTAEDSFINHGYAPDLDLSGHRSISAWIKPYSVDGIRAIACKGFYGYSLYVNDGKLGGIVGGDTAAKSDSSTAIITTNDWHHVAMTFDIDGDQKVHLYHNGIEVTYDTPRTTLSTPLKDTSIFKFRIGEEHKTRFFFDGIIDQVKVFDRALSPEQVRYYYLNKD